MSHSLSYPPAAIPADKGSAALAEVYDALDVGDFDRCEALAMHISEEAGRDDARVADAVRAHAAASLARYRRTDMERTAFHAATAQELGRRTGVPALRAEGEVAWARVLWIGGDMDEALRVLEELLPVVEDHGDARLCLHAHNLLGLVLADLGRLEVSLVMHERAMACARETGIPDLDVVASTNVAGRWLALGDRLAASDAHDEARDAWMRAVTIYDEVRALVRRHGNEHTLPHIVATYATARARLGDVDEALRAFHEQRELVERAGQRSSVAWSALELAAVHRDRGDVQSAREALADGIACCAELRAQMRLAALHEAASALEEAEGRYAEALTHYKRFHALQTACAVERAELRARLLAVRMETERAITDAQEARRQVSLLQEANTALEQQAHRARADARVDPLTGVANRRHLDETLASLHRGARERGRPLHVAVLDVDHFKNINDGFSHATGDEALRRVGVILTARCGPDDLCARYGGEEFVLVLPDAGADDALVFCESIRAAVETADWTAVAQGLRVTVSVGLADAARSPTATAGMESADEALYRAKRTGRNRVCVAVAAPSEMPRGIARSSRAPMPPSHPPASASPTSTRAAPS